MAVKLGLRSKDPDPALGFPFVGVGAPDGGRAVERGEVDGDERVRGKVEGGGFEAEGGGRGAGAGELLDGAVEAEGFVLESRVSLVLGGGKGTGLRGRGPGTAKRGHTMTAKVRTSCGYASS